MKECKQSLSRAAWFGGAICLAVALAAAPWADAQPNVLRSTVYDSTNLVPTDDPDQGAPDLGVFADGVEVHLDNTLDAAEGTVPDTDYFGIIEDSAQTAVTGEWWDMTIQSDMTEMAQGGLDVAWGGWGVSINDVGTETAIGAGTAAADSIESWLGNVQWRNYPWLGATPAHFVSYGWISDNGANNNETTAGTLLHDMTDPPGAGDADGAGPWSIRLRRDGDMLQHWAWGPGDNETYRLLVEQDLTDWPGGNAAAAGDHTGSNFIFNIHLFVATDTDGYYFNSITFEEFDGTQGTGGGGEGEGEGEGEPSSPMPQPFNWANYNATDPIGTAPFGAIFIIEGDTLELEVNGTGATWKKNGIPYSGELRAGRGLSQTFDQSNLPPSASGTAFAVVGDDVSFNVTSGTGNGSSRFGVDDGGTDSRVNGNDWSVTWASDMTDTAADLGLGWGGVGMSIFSGVAGDVGSGPTTHLGNVQYRNWDWFGQGSTSVFTAYQWNAEAGGSGEVQGTFLGDTAGGTIGIPFTDTAAGGPWTIELVRNGNDLEFWVQDPGDAGLRLGLTGNLADWVGNNAGSHAGRSFDFSFHSFMASANTGYHFDSLVITENATAGSSRNAYVTGNSLVIEDVVVSDSANYEANFDAAKQDGDTDQLFLVAVVAASAGDAVPVAGGLGLGLLAGLCALGGALALRRKHS